MVKAISKIFGNIKFEYRISIFYLVLGILWIYFSDTTFDIIFEDKRTLTKLHIIKGISYFIVTSIILFSSVKRHLRSLSEAKDRAEKSEQILQRKNIEYIKLNEELLTAKAKAEESDRLKSAFLANMSHEIRTPMNGILGFADLLKESNLSSEQQKNYISIIEKSGTRMLNIINDIVDISKIEAGLMKIELKESNINEQIECIRTFFEPEAESKGLTLTYKNTLPVVDATITTDQEKLYSILTNLVKNAIKYTEAGGIEIGCFKKGETFEFYVRDTGIGIPVDRQQAVFERFIQADVEDSKARQGAGLGLAITKSYISMLGGTIRLESQEGAGSTFFFTLPCIAVVVPTS